MRLDRLLVERGLVPSRDKAKEAIERGLVLVNGRPATKASRFVRPDEAVVVTSPERFVSRGGEKLFAAIQRFGVAVEGKICLDAGVGTGGFTDCLLTLGARRVYAVDVGYGQIAWRLRNDPRVVLRERTNLRYLRRADLGEAVELATLDLSFIGLSKVFPAVADILTEGGEVVALVKPQFEVGPQRVGRSGVVRRREDHLLALTGVYEASLRHGLTPVAAMPSPLRGAKGNLEFFLHLVKAERAALPKEALASCVEEAWLLVEEEKDGGFELHS